MGTDVNDKLIIGYGKDIKNINGKVSAFSVLKDITGFSKNNKGFELQKSNFANNAKDPFLVNESGLKIPINILTSEEKEGHKKYGQYYGGSFILTTPDMKKKILVSGSLQELDDLINKFKKDNNLTKLNIIKVDNGSYSRQFGTDNLEGINQEFWNKYEGLNNRGGNAIYTYKHGGKVTADTIYALNKKPKVVLTPDDIYENGGIVQAWIQKFQNGGMAKTATGGASSGMMGSMMGGAGGGGMGGMMGGGNPASMIVQGVSQAIGGIFSTLGSQKKQQNNKDNKVFKTLINSNKLMI